jgi:hypothetical protein
MHIVAPKSKIATDALANQLEEHFKSEMRAEMTARWSLTRSHKSPGTEVVTHLPYPPLRTYLAPREVERFSVPTRIPGINDQQPAYA